MSAHNKQLPELHLKIKINQRDDHPTAHTGGSLANTTQHQTLKVPLTSFVRSHSPQNGRQKKKRHLN